MFYRKIFMSFLLMQAVFSMSQLQYFQLSTIVELYKKNQETKKVCPLALIFHLAPYLTFIAVLKSTYPERMVLVTQYKQYFHLSAPLNFPAGGETFCLHFTKSTTQRETLPGKRKNISPYEQKNII